MDHLEQAHWFAGYGRTDKEFLRGQLHALIAIAEVLQFPPRIVMSPPEGER